MIRRIKATFNSTREKFIDSYQYVSFSSRQHLVAIISSLFISSILLFFVIQTQEIINVALFSGLILLLVISVFSYPLYNMQKDTTEIDIKFQKFITHITVLSLTNTNRVEVFRSISRDSESYGSLSDELKRFIILIDYFNLSLDEAASSRSKQTNSDIMSNFYERLSYNVGSGESLSSFLMSEQESYRSKYNSEYKSKMKIVNLMGETYVSIIIAGIYAFIVSSLLPVLVGTSNPIRLISVLTILLTLVQAFFTVGLNSITPKDKLWYFPDEGTRKEWKIYISFTIATLISVLSIVFILALNIQIPMYFYPIALTAPYIIPSIVIHNEEKKIIGAERRFPNFIRSLGSIESIRKTSTENVLNTIKNKDYGYLSDNIDNLYKRLWLNLDNYYPWKIFSEEISSNLIKKHSDMYIKGKQMGGSPEKLGETISENCLHLINLRKEKRTVTSELKTKIYGITIVGSVALFSGIEIVNLIIELGNNLETDPSEVIPVKGFLGTSDYNLRNLEIIVISLQFINILFASIMLRLFSQRNMLGTVIHISILTPICMSIGYIISLTLSSLLGFGGA